ncbi:MAG: 5'-nucleotidase C-terminal domain-containing protein [Anaerolineae bacterium]
MKTLRPRIPTLLFTLIILAALLLSVAPVAGAQAGQFTLTVLHTNDVHARILQFNAFGSACSDEDAAEGKCFGGVARRATKINEIRDEGGNVILVDAGDQFQGTLFYNQYKGEEAQRFMNALGYDAMTLGNHEFDDGPGVLGSFIRGANFPVVSANLDVSNEPELAGLIEPYTVLEVGGEQIGIIGYITEDTAILSSPGPNVVFKNIEESVAAAVAELEAMGVNKIVALSHAGFGRDREVAAAVDGLDVIVAGHTNTYLSNTDEEAEGPYPVVVNSPSGDPVLIVSDFTWGKYLGRLDVTFDEEGVPVAWEGNPITLDASVPEDPEVLAQAQALNEPLEELRNQIVGTAAVDLNGERASCRFEECNMGNLITDAILWKTAAEGTQIAFQNGGGIRASIAAGEVSLGDVLEVLPFGNTIATFKLTGADVWAALENGVSRAENPENEGTGRFAQVAGLRYTWNPDLPAGSRIVSVEVQNPDGTYAPLDLNAVYKVAANNFMRGGGDGYSMFAENAIDPYDYGPTLADAVAEYIAVQSPVTAAVEGRITRSTQAAPAELPTTGGAPMAVPVVLTAAGLALAGMGLFVRRRQD